MLGSGLEGSNEDEACTARDGETLSIEGRWSRLDARIDSGQVSSRSW